MGSKEESLNFDNTLLQICFHFIFRIFPDFSRFFISNKLLLLVLFVWPWCQWVPLHSHFFLQVPLHHFTIVLGSTYKKLILPCKPQLRLQKQGRGAAAPPSKFLPKMAETHHVHLLATLGIVRTLFLRALSKFSPRNSYSLVHAINCQS